MKDTTVDASIFDGSDASGLAALVHRNELEPRELVDFAIGRIEARNPQFNAVISQRFDAARNEALTVDRALPFAGVPLLLKDLNTMMKDEPCYNGARFLKNMDYRADHDSYVVERLRAAGFIVLGRSTAPEFGPLMTTEALAYGPTRNPWNPERSTGGSSGGAAAAVAGGMVPIAHATDGGGSIRMPASACGLIGLKATRGRVSMGPAIGETRMGAATPGCLCRSVRDSARFMDVISGYYPGDPYTAPIPARPYANEVATPPGRLRIGFMDRHYYFDGVVHPDCVAAVHKTAQLLKDLGHEVQDTHPTAMEEADDFTARFQSVMEMGADLDVSGWEARLGRKLGKDDVEPGTLWLRERGKQRSAAEFLDTARWLHGFGRRLAKWWAEDYFDILVTPVTSSPIGVLGRFSDPETAYLLQLREMQFTAQCNMSGQPAISLPMHETEAGEKVGVQFIAAFAREDLLYRLASQIENVVRWQSTVDSRRSNSNRAAESTT